MAAYKFKIDGLFPVDAQTAGEELDRIYTKTGTLDPAQIVSESRSAAAPLHPCFEWDDATAAEKYREGQAQKLMRAIVTVVETDSGPQAVRAIVSVAQDYRPIRVVLEDPKQAQVLLQTALKELKSFQRKYIMLTELAGVFAAIDQIMGGD